MLVQLEDPPPDGSAQEFYDKIAQELGGGKKLSDWDEALQAHVHSVDDAGRTLVIEVWRDEASMRRFHEERLLPLAKRLGMPIDELPVRVYETNNLVTS
jgi:hypothetical protein